MNENELALLRSVVQRPVQPASGVTLALLQQLYDGGYVTLEQSGWIATRKGCVAVEQLRNLPEVDRSAEHAAGISSGT